MYSSKSKFQRIEEAGEIKDLAQARVLINRLTEALNDTHGKLHTEFRNLERTASGTKNITIIGGGGSSSSSGGGTAIYSHRSYSVSIVAGTTPQRINFTSAMTGSYFLWWRAYDSNGVGFSVTILEADMDSMGFTISDSLSAGTLVYGTLPFA
jgi:hypothetical protein